MKIDLKNVTLFIRRTTWVRGLPSQSEAGDFIIVKFGEGNLTWNIRRAFSYELDRGLLDDVRRGDEEPLDVSFGGKYEFVSTIWTKPSPPQRLSKYQLSLEEVVRGRMYDGATVHPWITAGIEREPWLQCSPYCVQLEAHNDLRKECPDVLAMRGEALLWRYFRAETCDHDAKAGTVNVTGKCNILRPYAMNPYPITGGTPEWGYAVDADPIPFLANLGSVDPNTAGLWPPDRRDPLYPN